MKARSRISSILMIAIYIIQSCSGVFLHDTFKLASLPQKKNRCFFLTRFMTDAKLGSFTFNIGSRINRKNEVVSLQLIILDYNTWYRLFKLNDETQKGTKIFYQEQQDSQNNIIVKNFDLVLNTSRVHHISGTYGKEQKKYQDSREVDDYFFYICDSSGMIPDQNPKDVYEEGLVQYNIHVTDDRGREDSIDSNSSSKVYIWMVVVYAVLLLYNSTKIKRYYDGNKEVDYPLLVLLVACCVYLLYICIRLFGSYLEISGHRVAYIDVISIFLHLSYDSIMSILICLVMEGWSTDIEVASNMPTHTLLYLARVSSSLYSVSQSPEESVHHSTYDIGIMIISTVYHVAYLSRCVWRLKKTQFSHKFRQYFEMMIFVCCLHYCAPECVGFVIRGLMDHTSHHLFMFVMYTRDIVVFGVMLAVHTNVHGVYYKYSIDRNVKLVATTQGNLKPM